MQKKQRFATRFFGKRIFKRDSGRSECLPISQAKKELQKFRKEKCTSHWSSLSSSLPSIRTHARNVKCSCSRGPDFHVPLNGPCLSGPSASCSHKSWALRTWDWLGFHIPVLLCFPYLFIWAPSCFGLLVTMILFFSAHNNFVVIKFSFSKDNFLIISSYVILFH